MNDKMLTLLIAICIPIGCCLVLLGLTGDPFGRTVNNQMVEDAEASNGTGVVQTNHNTVSYTNHGEVFTVHISDKAWGNMGDKEKEKVAKEIAKNTVSKGCKKIIGITSGMKVLFTYEGNEDDYSVKFQ